MSNKGGGRKISPEWNEVINLESDTRVLCKYCKLMISRKIERVKNHLAKCKSKQEQSKLQNQGNSNVTETEQSISVSATEKSSAETVIDAEIQIDQCSAVKKRRLQTSVSNFVIKTSKEEQNSIDKKIATFFYSANIPFSVVESPQFVDMISSLRPGYSPPNRKQLSGTLLNEAAQEIEQKMKDDMEDATITLIQDGWSSINNNPMIGCSLHTGKEAYMLKITDVGSREKNAEYCAEIALKSIDECKTKFGKDVFAVCTDNEAKMGKMKDLLKEHHPNLLMLGCSAHYLNLVAKEISPINILNQVVEVQKYFRNVHQPHGWLKEHDCLMPQIPNSTRWNSYEECISTFIKNYYKYVTIASQHQNEFEVRISKILDNVAIYKESLNLQKQLSCVSVALDELQKDTTTLSRAVEIWKDLIETDELKQHKPVILKRYRQIIGPEHFLANMMDAKFLGKRLSLDEEDETEQWITENHADWLPAIMAFKIQDVTYFPKSLFSESIVSQFSAAKWWQILKEKVQKDNKNKLDSDFCSFFISLHSVPTSSASIERIFSTFGLIWSKLRNRLGAERCEKLVKIYKHYHRNQSEYDW